jgi:hypothetical protein
MNSEIKLKKMPTDSDGTLPAPAPPDDFVPNISPPRPGATAKQCKKKWYHHSCCAHSNVGQQKQKNEVHQNTTTHQTQTFRSPEQIL